MVLEQLEKKFKANMAEAFDAWVLADADKKPLYKEAWKLAESRLMNFYREHDASGEQSRTVML